MNPEVSPETSPPVLLQLEGLRFGWPGGGELLQGIDLQLAAGQCHVLLGRSGCGKSSLLKLAAGLLAPTAGAVRWRGRPVRGPQADVALVFQRPTLLDWLSVLDNVLLPISLHRPVQPQDRAHARHWLERLGLQGLATRRPAALSGGQQSRVAIARAWMQRPALLCMDEPFAALDALTREELQQDLLAVCAEQGTAVLFVTHDLAEAAFLGDRVSLLHGGRLGHTLALDEPRPRQARWRDAPAFHGACAQLRRALEACA
jgi:NitT/TauT family transport system ATP-binding protein